MTDFKLIAREDIVYRAINEERDYQDSLISKSESDGRHSITEFVSYMEDYIQEARHVGARVWGPVAAQKQLGILRKVVALGVSCMEQHGVVRR